MIAVPPIFQNFAAGYGEGQDIAQRRREQNALAQAGALYAGGDAEAAENALVAAGMPERAASYSALAEARRARQGRTRVQGAIAAVGADASPAARITAGANAALEGGDVDQYAQLVQTVSALGAQERAQAAERNEFIGRIAVGLRGNSMTPQQRQAAAQQALAGSPYANDPHMAPLVQDPNNFTDERLGAAINQAQSLSDILAGHRQDEQMQRHILESDRDFNEQRRQFGAQLSAQTAARHDPRERVQYQIDLRRIGARADAARMAATYVVPRLNRAEQIVARLAELGGMSSPLDANVRIELSRIAQANPEARGLLGELQRIQTQFTVEDARALAPVSNTDFGRLQEINPNGNMTVDQAFRIINTMRNEVQRGIEQTSAESQWIDRYGGLTGVNNENGESFEQVMARRYADAGRNPASAPTELATPPAATHAELPNPAAMADGTRARNPATGQRMIVRGGRWVPDVPTTGLSEDRQRAFGGQLR